MTDTAPSDWHRDLGPRWLWHQWPDGAMLGNGCECWVTPESEWFTYGSAVEPGSQVEFNPACPIHRTHTHDGVRLDKAIKPRSGK